jgi:hypothetical protein
LNFPLFFFFASDYQALSSFPFLTKSPATTKATTSCTFSLRHPDGDRLCGTASTSSSHYITTMDQQNLWLDDFHITAMSPMYHASTPQFQARQPAAMQMLPDVAVPYFPNEPTSAPAPGLQHHASSGSSYQKQASPGDRAPLLQQNYPGAMGLGGMPQPPPEIMEEEDFQQQFPGMEAAYTAYETALKEIFQNIINGRLADASLSLLEVSEWLLGHVVDLGKFAFLLFDLAH